MPGNRAAVPLIAALFALAASPASGQSLRDLEKNIESQLAKSRGEAAAQACRYSKDTDWERLTCAVGPEGDSVTIAEFLGDKAKHWAEVLTVTCGEDEAKVLPDGSVSKVSNGIQAQHEPRGGLAGALMSTKMSFQMGVLDGNCRKPVEFAYDEHDKNGLPRGILDFPGGNPTPA